jgi:hypothetical protein
VTESRPPKSWRPLLGVGVIGDAEFGVRAGYNDRQLMLALRGSADFRNHEMLGSVLRDLHTKALDMKATQVDVDVRSLEFMASSCFKQFVTWLNDVQLSQPTEQYKIRFVSDTTKYWQRRSLGALSAFASELVEISTTD